MTLATVNGVYRNGASGLWRSLQGYNVVLPLIISPGIVIVGIAIYIWGASEKIKQYRLELEVEIHE